MGRDMCILGICRRRFAKPGQDGLARPRKGVDRRAYPRPRPPRRSGLRSIPPGAYPHLFDVLLHDARTSHLFRDLCLRANDKPRVVAAGIPASEDDVAEAGRLAILTRREGDVLALDGRFRICGRRR
jgi:hypothetical protein